MARTKTLINNLKLRLNFETQRNEKMSRKPDTEIHQGSLTSIKTDVDDQKLKPAVTDRWNARNLKQNMTRAENQAKHSKGKILTGSTIIPFLGNFCVLFFKYSFMILYFYQVFIPSLNIKKVKIMSYILKVKGKCELGVKKELKNE